MNILKEFNLPLFDGSVFVIGSKCGGGKSSVIFNLVKEVSERDGESLFIFSDQSIKSVFRWFDKIGLRKDNNVTFTQVPMTQPKSIIETIKKRKELYPNLKYIFVDSELNMEDFEELVTCVKINNLIMFITKQLGNSPTGGYPTGSYPTCGYPISGYPIGSRTHASGLRFSDVFILVYRKTASFFDNIKLFFGVKPKNLTLSIVKSCYGGDGVIKNFHNNFK